MLTGAVAAGALLAVSASAQAADPYTFALVPKNTNNPFFDQALAGCKKAEKELAGAVKCLYIGPGEHGGGDEEAQIVADLVTKKVDGIAVSGQRAGHGQCAPGRRPREDSGSDLGFRPPSPRQGFARGLCRHAQL